MSDKEDHFGPEAARHYDEDSADMFAPEQVAPAVDLLASQTHRVTPPTGSTGPARFPSGD